jgi:hypothetical protein
MTGSLNATKLDFYISITISLGRYLFVVLLAPEGIIHPVVSALTLTWFMLYIYARNKIIY